MGGGETAVVVGGQPGPFPLLLGLQSSATAGTTHLLYSRPMRENGGGKKRLEGEESSSQNVGSKETKALTVQPSVHKPNREAELPGDHTPGEVHVLRLGAVVRTCSRER